VSTNYNNKGVIVKEVTWNKGKIEGNVTVYKKGKKSRCDVFLDGRETIYYTEWVEDGSKTFERIAGDDGHKTYIERKWLNGILNTEKLCTNNGEGDPYGIVIRGTKLVTIFHRDGTKKIQYEVVDNWSHGKISYWDKNGNLVGEFDKNGFGASFLPELKKDVKQKKAETST
jgi:antitoxin component YwqK of YwqJK toxin-antitoxin module